MRLIISLILHYERLRLSMSIIHFGFVVLRRTSFVSIVAVEEDGCSGGGSDWGGWEDSGGRTTSPESPD